MAEPHRDDSISPMTKPPASNTAASTLEPHNDAVPISTPQDAATAQSKGSNGSSVEAEDYINGGQPHEDLSPVSALDNSIKQVRRPFPIPLEPVAKDGPPTSTEGVPNNGNNTPEVSSPIGRRSVQFARNDMVLEPHHGHTRDGSWDDPDGLGKSRTASFMSKLKALASTSGLQTPKSPGLAMTGEGNMPSNTNSPTTARAASRIPHTLNESHESSDADADAEETADEGVLSETSRVKRVKRRMRRPKKLDQASTPNTPNARYPGETDSPIGYGRLALRRRRASLPEASEHQHGMSEGEGRDQLSRDVNWRRGSSWVSGSGRNLTNETEDADSPVGRRIGHIRRITVFGGGGVSDGDAMTPRRPFFSGERASTYGAQKWKQVKNTLKLLRQKKDERFDYYKSAELMAELRAGAPAALMLASMIQRDEHGNKRIPVLLEQVKLRISDSAPSPDDDSERHWVFTMNLEYGSGPSRMKWTIIRTLRDIYNLHIRYKFALRNEKYLHGRADVNSRPKQPKFPWRAFPYLRGARKKAEESDEEEELASVQGDETAGEHTAGDATADGTASEIEGRIRPPRKKSRLGLLGMRRKSTGLTDIGDGQGNDSQANAEAARRRYVDRQRTVLEKYLQEMIRWLMFRADSNRLCRFLELSALGVRLAAEGSYHGKECYLHIQSSKGIDFRRVLTPKKVIARHSRKWFLVRQSYIVCIESPENMNVYDVYLVDSKFRIVSKRKTLKQIGSKSKKEEIDLMTEAPPEKHHTLTLHTAERKVRLFSRNQAILKQFEDSISEMLKQTQWHLENRFGSFAPPRAGVFAQWLVDGRDYMWNVSRAINMARDVIYIHDWWLSPELYMRRPACISQKWRLDRLLQRKAREGVKIFVIVYRNVEAAMPIDSAYTKFSLLNLHPNVFVQRSPNQFKKNQFFFAHHEKLCIVDHDVAFVGGIDLCFGRWDCPQHPLVDDKPTGFEPDDHPKDAEHCQLFPGKDYSNPRVLDFFKLNEPYEEMYERSKVARMPWHDISMQVVGQPARDLTRHFVQRWNYIRRGRKSTRPLPFLLPPPDAKQEELEALGLTGTCEVQILRSAAAWSLGIEDVEQSIHTAYIKMIEDSEHFVYMENQFFITSTEAFNTKIVNRIGDALVDRIIRAYENNEDWKCIIIIPLMPGFQNTVDEQEGTSVRIIVHCQYQSICRGPNSIFGRLRAADIDPEDYIQFYSLRQWGRFGGGALCTEQLYIHAKTMVVDDRVALIGSANINERSMLGSRDSECAAVVRDTDMIWSTMAGKPYQVGRFAHTLRLRLMREHLGLDVDEILEEERQEELDRNAQYEAEMEEIYSENPLSRTREETRRRRSDQGDSRPQLPHGPSFNHDVAPEMDEEVDNSPDKGKEAVEDPRVMGNKVHDLEVAGFGPDHWKSAEALGLDQGRDSVILNGREILVHDIISEGKGTLDNPKEPHKRRLSQNPSHEDDGLVDSENLPPVPPLDRRTTDQLGLPRAIQLPALPIVDDTDIGGPPIHIDSTGRRTSARQHRLASDITLAYIDKDCMRDPLNPSFIEDIWNRAAENNTKLFRRVFRCMPDSEVTTWNEYKDYGDYAKQFKENMEGMKRSEEDDTRTETSHPPTSSVAAAGVVAPGPEAIVKAAADVLREKLPDHRSEDHNPTIIIPDEDNGNNSEKKDLDLRTDSSGKGAKLELGIDAEKLAYRQNSHDVPSPIFPSGDTPFPAFDGSNGKFLEPQREKSRERRATFSPLEKPASRETSVPASQNIGSVKRRRRATTKGSRRGLPPDEVLPQAEAEELLSLVQGQLVQFPYDWLVTEEANGNWGFQVDGVAPLQI
jgi:phospholipase D1/2